MENNNDATSFVHSFAYNFSGQLFARLLSFSINFYLLRVVDKEILGVANVRLTLLYTTVLFLAREPFRKTCLETKDADITSLSAGDAINSKAAKKNDSWSSQELQRIVNLAWLCPVICLLLCVLLSFVWTLLLSHPDSSIIPNYTNGVAIFCLCAFIESLAEPLRILSQKYHLVKLVAISQSVQVLLQRFIVAGVLFLFPSLQQINSFYIAMLISSAFFTTSFYGYYWLYFSSIVRDRRIPLKRFYQLFPTLLSFSVDTARLSLTKMFFFHSIVKQMLTDGSQYVMTFFDVLNFGDQGIYDAIEKLGGLVARILLAPLEESAYVYFTTNISRDRSGGGSLDQVKNKNSKLQVATRILAGLLRCVTIVGLVVSVFGIPYSYLALKIYGGDLLSLGTGPMMLRVYSFYIFLLALNGITECFSFAAMNEKEIGQHRLAMLLFAFVYVGAQLLLASLFGGVGFILGNCINMFVRILYSVLFIKKFYKSVDLNGDNHPLLELIPPLDIVFCLLASLFFAFISERMFCCDGVFNTAAHMAIGGMLLLFVAHRTYTRDEELSLFIERYLNKRRWTKKAS